MPEITHATIANALASAMEGRHFMLTHLAVPNAELIFAGGLSNFLLAIPKAAPDATAQDISDALAAYARTKARPQ